MPLRRQAAPGTQARRVFRAIRVPILFPSHSMWIEFPGPLALRTYGESREPSLKRLGWMNGWTFGPENKRRQMIDECHNNQPRPPVSPVKQLIGHRHHQNRPEFLTCEQPMIATSPPDREAKKRQLSGKRCPHPASKKRSPPSQTRHHLELARANGYRASSLTICFSVESPILWQNRSATI